MMRCLAALRMRLRPAPPAPPAPPKSSASPRRPVTPPVPRSPRAPLPPGGRGSRYDALVAGMLDRYDIRVRRWRTSMSGVAVLVRHSNGSHELLLEAPYPRGPMSAAVFLHEVAHHAIGVGTIRPRCLEEWAAWQYALALMRESGVSVTPPVEKRIHRSLELAVRRAVRRGMRRLPEQLRPYCPPDLTRFERRPRTAARSRSRAPLTPQ